MVATGNNLLNVDILVEPERAPLTIIEMDEIKKLKGAR